MKKLVKVFALMSILTLATSTLSGCTKAAEETTVATDTTSNADETVKTDETSEATNTDKSMEKYETPIEITSVMSLGDGGLKFPEGDSIESNTWTREYAESLGIDLKFLWTTNGQQYSQKLNIAITSDDLPDAMVVSNTQLKMMYENGQLTDLTEILPEYQSELTKSVLNFDNGISLKSATFDGKLSAIPQVASGLSSSPVLWIRTDWLDKLGLEEPKTVEEMLAISDAFTNNDPNGTGKNDTYGIGIHKDIAGTGFSDMDGFFNSYGAFPNMWVKSGDSLMNGSIMPETKVALAAIKNLYEIGQIDPEFGVKDANKVAEDVSANKIGMFYGQFWNAAWINDAKVAEPTMEWMPIPIPENAEGTTKAQSPFGTSQYVAVSSKAKNPEAVIKMLNLNLEKSYGETAEPTKYGITPEGYGVYSYSPFGLQPPMKNINAGVNVSEAVNAKDPSKLNDEEKNYYEMAMKSLEGDYANNNWHQLKMFGPDGAFTVIKNYNDAGKIQNNEFFGAPTKTMTQKLSTLNKQQLTDYTAIILGEPIEKFDTFVENWNKLGGEEMTNEVNEWYNSNK